MKDKFKYSDHLHLINYLLQNLSANKVRSICLGVPSVVGHCPSAVVVCKSLGGTLKALRGYRYVKLASKRGWWKASGGTGLSKAPPTTSIPGPVV